MRELILEWHELGVPPYRPRQLPARLPRDGVRKVELFTGCRRAGKTYLMFQVIDRLRQAEGVDPKDIVYLNFEDERAAWETQVLTGLLPTLVELFGERDYYLFLDEIHHIPDWGRWVRRVHDRHQNIRLYLTSSSSQLSKKEVPNALRGRMLAHEVFPLSFREFVAFRGSEPGPPTRWTAMQRAKLRRLRDEYLAYGGFPELVLEPSERRRKAIIQDYFRTIITLDICDRYGVTRPSLLHDYVKLVLGQTVFSTTKTYNILRSQGLSVGKETLLTYTRYLEEVYFCFFVPIFSPKVRNRLYYPRKVYFIDNAFINHVTPASRGGRGRSLENAVCIELLRRYDGGSIHYWKDAEGHEVDFVLAEGGHVTRLIQVCHDTSDPATREREVRALSAAAEALDCDRLLVITGDESGTESIAGYEIEFVPLEDWLLTVEP